MQGGAVGYGEDAVVGDDASVAGYISRRMIDVSITVRIMSYIR